MNDKNYDFLRELTEVDDMKISEIAKKYPVPDKETLKRINEKCEEKMKMRQNNNIEENTGNNWQENVEVVRNTPWYGNPWITSVACFVILLGSTIGIMTLFNGKQREPYIPDNPPITSVETSTEAVSAETTIESDLAVITDTQTTIAGGTVTAEIIQDFTEEATETSEQNNESTEMSDEQPEEKYPSDVIKRLSESMYALNFIEQIMSNGPEFECDMDDNFTDDSGQLYVKVTESGFNSIADVENYVRSYLTDNFISNRYSVLVDKNSGKFIETENGLYIRYAPKAAAFNLMDKKIFAKGNDDTYMVIGCYDNYGVLSTIDVNFVYDGDNLKIDAIKFNE